MRSHITFFFCVCVFFVFLFFSILGWIVYVAFTPKYAKAQFKNGERKQREVNRFSALPLRHIYQEE